MSHPTVFISHSVKDADTAEAVARLVRDAFSLEPSKIRCTSVEGYGLRAGATIDSQLREEALAAQAFIAIVSSRSLASTFVLFEIGARWGAQKSLIPLLIPGENPEILSGPLIGLNALSCSSRGSLHQLISDISKYIGAKAGPPETYVSSLEAICEIPSKAKTLPEMPEELHHVSLAVRELGRSVRFYRITLRLRQIRRPKFNFKGAWFQLPSGQHLHLVVNPSGTYRDENKPLDFRDSHFALRVRNFREFYAYLEKKGLDPLVDPSLPTGFPQCYILDPDSHVVEINSKDLKELPSLARAGQYRKPRSGRV
jgi:catechol 2,3-dioxygenase-like lactoylglutathione lyase family enzyme